MRTDVGRGVRTADGDDMRIARTDGTSFNVDLSGLTTVQDVVAAINAADLAAGITRTLTCPVVHL